MATPLTWILENFQNQRTPLVSSFPKKKTQKKIVVSSTFSKKL
jgi:hypothetical protein